MRALVLSGGAVKGAYQVGVLKRWMFEQERDYDILCGVSVGALNVSGLAQIPLGQPKAAWEKMNSIWTSINTATIYKQWWPFGIASAVWKTSVFDSQPLINYVNKNLNVPAIQRSGRIIRVGATCLNTGEHKYGTEKDSNLADWVLASSSYPIFLKPIEIDGKLWSDGGICSITPLAEAINLGATEIDVIMCSNPDLADNWTSSSNRAVPDMVIRVLDLMSDQILKADLTTAGLKNNLASLDSKYSHIKIRLVQPSTSLVNNSLLFDPADIVRMIELGYNDADNFVTYG